MYRYVCMRRHKHRGQSSLRRHCSFLTSFDTSSHTLAVCVKQGDVLEWAGDSKLSPTLALTWHQLIYTNDRLVPLLQIHSFLGLTRVLALFASNPYLVKRQLKKAITCRRHIVSDKQDNVAEDNKQLLSTLFSLLSLDAPFIFLHCTHLETFITTSPATIVTANCPAHTADRKQPWHPALTLHSSSSVNRPEKSFPFTIPTKCSVHESVQLVRSLSL